MNRPTLTLVQKGQYFDMVVDGDKREEYREIKPYWERVLAEGCNGAIKIHGVWYDANDVDIVFARGYQSDRPTIRVKCTGLIKGYPQEKWSGPEFVGKEYFILKFEPYETRSV